MQFWKDVKMGRRKMAKTAGMKLGHLDSLYETRGGMLGSEDFVDSMIHRIGEFDARAASIRRNAAIKPEIRADLLIGIVESDCGVTRDDFCGPAKGPRYVFAKEALISSVPPEIGYAGRRYHRGGYA